MHSSSDVRPCLPPSAVDLYFARRRRMRYMELITVMTPPKPGQAVTHISGVILRLTSAWQLGTRIFGNQLPCASTPPPTGRPPPRASIRSSHRPTSNKIPPLAPRGVNSRTGRRSVHSSQAVALATIDCQRLRWPSGATGAADFCEFSRSPALVGVLCSSDGQRPRDSRNRSSVGRADAARRSRGGR